MNFKDLYIKGMLAKHKQKYEADMAGEKRYRGGNTGILIDGLPANSCSRKMIARSEGREEEVDWQTQLMFDLGELNETRWHDKLKAAGVTVESADNKVRAVTKGGIPITGSPDSIIISDGTEEYLIEHKHVSSFWTFRDVMIENKPKLENLAQAGFYMMHLNDIPSCLLYTSSTLFSGPAFLTNLVPKPSEKHSELFEYTYYMFTGQVRNYKQKDGSTKPIKMKKKLEIPGHLKDLYPKELFNTLGADFAEFKNTRPGIKQFDLRWTDDRLEYEADGKWYYTVVTKQNIMDYFNQAEIAEKNEELPPRPLQLAANGEAKSYTACDYCSLSDVCDKYENDYKIWLKEAKSRTW
jgi:hypothetical protein